MSDLAELCACSEGWKSRHLCREIQQRTIESAKSSTYLSHSLFLEDFFPWRSSTNCCFKFQSHKQEQKLSTIMALPHTMDEEEGEGDDLDLQPAVPEDVQAVMVAAEEGDALALSRALANLTSGVDCEGEDGDRPLHIACLYGHDSCVQILLAAGANIEVRDEDGGLPLHDACAGGYKEVVSMLIRAASSQDQLKRILNAFDVDGDTPLHHAARGNHVDVVELLLDSGSNPKISNLMGQCPADLADPDSAAQVRLLTAVEKLNT